MTAHNQGKFPAVFNHPPCLQGRKSHQVGGTDGDTGRLFCGACGYLYPKSPTPKAKKHSTRGAESKTAKRQQALIERDGNTCHWCGVTLTTAMGIYNRPNWRTIEHLVPRVQGGGNEWHNLVLACLQCNTTRGGSVEDIARWNVRMVEEGHRCDNTVCIKIMRNQGEIGLGRR